MQYNYNNKYIGSNAWQKKQEIVQKICFEFEQVFKGVIACI